MIRCGYPGHLVNGLVIGRSYLFGDVVHYSCNEGYRLEGGPKSRQCNENGTWSQQKPVCKEINCIFDKSQFPNGHLSNLPLPIRKVGLKSYYKVGAQIHLFCDHPDAEMDGFSRLTCTSGGTWDYELPICHQLPCSKLPQ